MARKNYFVVLATVIGLSLCMPVRSVLAQESFYKGKTVRIIVGLSPGGGYGFVGKDYWPTYREIYSRAAHGDR